MRLATIVRDMPQAERAALLSFRGSTSTAPFSIETAMSSEARKDSSPFGPFMVTVCPLTAAVTPFGTETGFLPMRDMTLLLLEYGADEFAADVLVARFGVRHDPLRRRQD